MRYFFCISLLFLATLTWGQSMMLTDFNQQRLKKQQAAMLVLGAWAVGNVGSGLALRGQTTGADRYFHEMNIGWGAINLTLAGLGYWSSMKADPGSFDLASTIAEQHKIQKILLLNTGLDVGYVLGGAYLIERSKNTTDNPERLKGFGRSIILQGGFLFVFDLATYLVHANQNKDIPKLLEGLSFTVDRLGLYLTF